MSTADTILEFIEEKGPTFVVTQRRLGHIAASAKTVNKALERLTQSGKLERVSRGAYRLAEEADPVEVAEDYARAVGTKLRPIGGLCYEVLGLEQPLNAIKNTFVSVAERSPILINGKVYKIVRGRLDEYNVKTRIGAALRLLEMERKNLVLVVPLLKHILTVYELANLAYHITRYASAELKQEPLLLRMLEGFKESRKYSIIK